MQSQCLCYMEITSKIDKKNNIVYRKCTGSITIMDIIQEIKNTMLKKAFEENMNGVWDFSTAKLDISVENLEGLYPWLETVEDSRGNRYKVALIINRDNYPIAAVHAAFSMIKMMPFEMKIFSDIMETKGWLGLDDDVIQNLTRK